MTVFDQKLRDIEIESGAKSAAFRWFSWAIYSLISAAFAMHGYAIYLAAITGATIFPPLVIVLGLAVAGAVAWIGYRRHKANAKRSLASNTDQADNPLHKKTPQPSQLAKQAAWRWFWMSMLLVAGAWIGTGFPLVLLCMGILCAVCIAKIGYEVTQASLESDTRSLRLAKLNVQAIDAKLYAAKLVLDQQACGESKSTQQSVIKQERMSALQTALDQFKQTKDLFKNEITLEQYRELIQPEIEKDENEVNTALAAVLEIEEPAQETPPAIIHGKYQLFRGKSRSKKKPNPEVVMESLLQRVQP